MFRFPVLSGQAVLVVLFFGLTFSVIPSVVTYDGAIDGEVQTQEVDIFPGLDSDTESGDDYMYNDDDLEYELDDDLDDGDDDDDDEFDEDDNDEEEDEQNDGIYECKYDTWLNGSVPNLPVPKCDCYLISQYEYELEMKHLEVIHLKSELRELRQDHEILAERMRFERGVPSINVDIPIPRLSFLLINFVGVIVILPSLLEKKKQQQDLEPLAPATPGGDKVEESPGGNKDNEDDSSVTVRVTRSSSRLRSSCSVTPQRS